MAKKSTESCVSVLFKMTILLLIMGLVIISVLFFGYQKLNEFFNRGGTVLIPDFRGMHIVEVFRIKPAGLEIVRRDEKFDSKHERDHVIAQYPDPGTVVRPGKNILLSISLGAQTVNVPDMRGNAMREAELALLNAQLKIGNRAYIYSDSIGHDRIINHSPLPNEESGINRDVDLLISLGRAPGRSLLSNMSGLNLDMARTKLSEAGLKVGRIFSTKDPTRAKFQVISTNPPPYSEVSRGETITILISSGDDPGNATQSNLQEFFIIPNLKLQKPLFDSSVEKYYTLDTSSSQPSQPEITVEDKNTGFKPIPIVTPLAIPEKEISFVMPDGFVPKEIKFIHITDEGRRQVYVETHNPLDLVKVKVPAIAGSRVQIYINDVPINEKRIDP